MAQEMATSSEHPMARSDDGEATRAVVYRPDTDIYETEEHVVLVADMPGVAPEAVELTLEGRLLTLRGRVAASPREGYRLLYSEYGEGDFERGFTLSEDFDRERIDASHKNGVLTVHLPKAAAVRTRQIDVKAG